MSRIFDNLPENFCRFPHKSIAQGEQRTAKTAQDAGGRFVQSAMLYGFGFV